MTPLHLAAVAAFACALGAPPASAPPPLAAAPAATPASPSTAVPAAAPTAGSALPPPAGTSAAPAPEVPPQPRLSFGARVALAFPQGDLQTGAAMDDRIARAIPLELRAGWRVTPELDAGLQGGYEAAEVSGVRSRGCLDTGVSCDAHLWRIAARGEYSRRRPDYFPWAAVTLGWEWAVERWERDAAHWEQSSRSGWLAGVEAGIDRPFTRYFDGGFFVGFAIGQYHRLAVTGETVGYGYSGSTWVDGPPLHRWLTIGLRGNFTVEPRQGEAPAARATGARKTPDAR